ncbi:hypothetical protein [Pseudoruegeria sp. SHC-113]|uniref:hypothetical protein n=1 Tax=Pseudoruegeria sp. SHC-113 TaxID=2855439 RepID=UPI0021BAB6E8|nr:hypothetical protein [Pseudoruegeria sp. SHC-113]MCT8158630.1 hypothetical protein [Pseudoruegeria sp. SHC-113]
MAISKREALARALTPFCAMFGQRFRNWTTGAVNPRGKLYIPSSLGVAGFFRALSDAGAGHVVLRWFEDLPHVEAGHDIDILVADDAVETVRGLLSEWPEGQKIDFYSETGFQGTGYKPNKITDVPAFPPHVAAEILASASAREGGWSVPDARTHFLGLAYHAVYLKGYESGLPRDEGSEPRKKASHDYATVLTELGQKAGYDLAQPVTLASLDAFLRSVGWAPDADHLRALAPSNSWITPPP